MATKGSISVPYFFIFDFFLMKSASDENDVVPKAISYFYPNDEQTKQQVLIIIYTKIELFFSNLENFRLWRNYWHYTIF